MYKTVTGVCTNLYAFKKNFLYIRVINGTQSFNFRVDVFLVRVFDLYLTIYWIKIEEYWYRCRHSSIYRYRPSVSLSVPNQAQFTTMKNCPREPERRHILRKGIILHVCPTKGIVLAASGIFESDLFRIHSRLTWKISNRNLKTDFCNKKIKHVRFVHYNIIYFVIYERHILKIFFWKFNIVDYTILYYYSLLTMVHVSLLCTVLCSKYKLLTRFSSLLCQYF